MSIRSNIDKIKYYLKRYGFFKTLVKVLKRLLRIKENRKSNLEQYKIWMEKFEPKSEDYEKQKNVKFEYMPKISVVTPMYNTNEKYFKELVESLKEQTYTNWELCLADGSDSQNPAFKQIIETDNRIKYKFLNENKGISENTNRAIELVTGEYVGFLDHDDLLSKDALFEVVTAINKNEVLNINEDNIIDKLENDELKNIKPDFIYTDEDKIDETYERFEPYFKPDFSPHTLECNNYITHFVVVKKELIDKVGPLNPKFNGAQDFDFVLRATEKAKKIVHIPKILYHWRVHKSSTANVADSKPYAYEAGIKVIEEHLKRTGKKGIVEYGQDVPGIYKIKYEVIGNPKVSIIIPNKDNIRLLKNCINSILSLTTYTNYEIVVIENNSQKKETFEFYNEIVKNNRIKVLNYNDNNSTDFNYSALINFAVKNIDGEYVLQLNNDTKLLTKDWLELFIGYSQNKEIGIVGARLYYEDKSIQHAGIILGLSGIAGNSLVNLPYGKHAYFGREAATRDVIAVTGACLFARKEIYEEIRIYG